MTTVTHSEGTFINNRGVTLYTQEWVSEAPSARVCIVHGVGEHSGRYDEYARFCARQRLV